MPVQGSDELEERLGRMLEYYATSRHPSNAHLDERICARARRRQTRRYAVIGSVVAVVSIALAAAVLSNRTPKSPATLAGPPASAGQTSTKAGTPSVPISAAWQQVAGWPVGGAGAGNTDTVALAERALSAVLRQGDITDVVQQRLLVVGPECALAALRDHAGRLTVVVFGLSKGSDGVFPWVPGAPTSEAAGVYALVTGVGAGTQCVAVAASPTITRIVVSDSANATSDRQISAQHGDAIWTEAAGNPASPSTSPPTPTTR